MDSRSARGHSAQTTSRLRFGGGTCGPRKRSRSCPRHSARDTGGGWMGLGDDVPHTSSCREQGRWARAHLRDRGDALVLEQFVRVVTSDDLALVVVLSAGRACGQGDDGMAALKSHRRPLINHGGGRLEHRRESLLVKKGHDLRDLDVLGAIAACVGKPSPTAPSAAAASKAAPHQAHCRKQGLHSRGGGAPAKAAR